MSNGEGGGGGFPPQGVVPEGPSLPNQPKPCGDIGAFRDNAILRRAEDAFDSIFAFLTCKGMNSYLAWLLAGLSTVPIGIAGIVAGLLLAPLAKLASLAGSTVLEALGEARKDAAPELNKLTIATLNELFGAEFNDADLPGAGDPKAALARARILGDKVLGLLEKEFVPAGELSPAQGQLAAKAFTGFSVNFAVVSSFIAILGEMATAGQLESFRELGVELAEALGLGRMARRGLSELVSSTVSDPYEWFLNKKYHPKLLGQSQVINAFFARLVSEEDMFEELERQGFAPAKIRALVELNKDTVGLDDLELLVRYGAMSRVDAVDRLTRKGFTPDEAELALRVVDMRRVDALVRSQAAVYQQQVLDGVLDFEQLALLLEPLPLTDEEKLVLRRTTAARVELPRRFLTLAQMRDALRDGIVDIEEFDEFLVREGYSSDDATILRIDALLRLARAKEADEEKARRAEARGKVAPPP